MFGALMHMMGMIAGLVGAEGAGVGWVVHLAISALLGLGYALTFGAASRSWGHAAAFGAVYGMIWWVLGALLAMPAKMGMPLLQVGEMQLQSLMGHVLYGLTLGLVVHASVQVSEDSRVPSRA